MTRLLCHLLRENCRNFIKHCESVRYIMHKGAYDGDGKTTVTILNNDADYGLMVDAISPSGFKLNVGINVLGPMIIFPRTVIAWNLRSSNDINEDSLTLFKVILPRPDIIILGLDDNYPWDAPLLVDFKKIIKNLNMNMEILPVDKACTTFNYLNSEKRFVVGAFLPPKNLDTIDQMKLQIISVRRGLNEPVRAIDD